MTKLPGLSELYRERMLNFTSGLACLQSYNALSGEVNASVRVMVDDDDLVWAWVQRAPRPDDALDLIDKGWDTTDGLAWKFRLSVSTHRCPDRIKSEAEVAELHAQF